MPSRIFWPLRRPNAPSTSLPSNNPTPGSSFFAHSAPEPPTACLPANPNVINGDSSHRSSVWDATVAVALILDDIPALPLALAGPLTQVLDVMSGMINAVNTMRETKDGCARLIYRVLRFLQSLVVELRTIKATVPDDTPTAARLFALKSNLMAIRDDVNQWSRLSLLDRYLQRNKIAVALSRHGENLTDCLNTFHILTSIRASTLADGVETIIFPGPSVLVTRKGDKEGLPSSIPSASLHDLFQGPAGQVIFQQIGVAVQGRLEEMGLRATSTLLGPRSPAVTVLQTGYNHHVSYLTAQISELTAEVGSVLPELAVPTHIEARFMGRPVYRPQTGDPTPQLRETVSATLQLLNDLHNIPRVTLDAAMLADKMTHLSLNLSDLGLREEAFEVQTSAVVLHHAGRDTPGLAASLSQLSSALWHLGRREEAVRTIEEAVNHYHSLVADQPNVFHPDLAYSLVTLGVYFSEFGRQEEAITASREALIIYRRLATDRPDAFAPDLARSLVSFANRLSEFGPHEEALKANGEAVSIYRPLAPDIFRPDLARSLVNFSKRLSEFGHHEEAVSASKEAVSIYRPLAADRPDVFRPRLATSLVNLSRRLSGYGRHEEGLVASEEATSIYRSLAGERPSVFNPDLARSLTSLFDVLSGLGRVSEALLAIQETIKLLRPLAVEYPTAFSGKLAESLSALSRCYLDMGRQEDALKGREEAEGLLLQ